MGSPAAKAPAEAAPAAVQTPEGRNSNPQPALLTVPEDTAVEVQEGQDDQPALPTARAHKEPTPPATPALQLQQQLSGVVPSPADTSAPPTAAASPIMTTFRLDQLPPQQSPGAGAGAGVPIVSPLNLGQLAFGAAAGAGMGAAQQQPQQPPAPQFTPRTLQQRCSAADILTGAVSCSKAGGVTAWGTTPCFPSSNGHSTGLSRLGLGPGGTSPAAALLTGALVSPATSAGSAPSSARYHYGQAPGMSAAVAQASPMQLIESEANSPLATPQPSASAPAGASRSDAQQMVPITPPSVTSSNNMQHTAEPLSTGRDSQHTATSPGPGGYYHHNHHHTQPVPRLALGAAADAHARLSPRGHAKDAHGSTSPRLSPAAATSNPYGFAPVLLMGGSGSLGSPHRGGTGGQRQALSMASATGSSRSSNR